MQMSDAVEVKQMFGDSAVTALLAEGWKLLAVVASTYGDGKENVVRPCYVLGKPKAPVLSPGAMVGKVSPSR